MATSASEQVSLADAKARLSEAIEGIETEHRRVVITKHGRPSLIVLAVEGVEAIEDTLDVLSDSDVLADLREAAAARRTGTALELTREGARAGRVDEYAFGGRGPQFAGSTVSRHHRHGWWAPSWSFASDA